MRKENEKDKHIGKAKKIPEILKAGEFEFFEGGIEPKFYKENSDNMEDEVKVEEPNLEEEETEETIDPNEEASLEDEELDDLLEDILDEEDIYTEEDEEEPKADEDFVGGEKKKHKEEQAAHIKLSDFITSEMAIETYQEFWVGVLSGVGVMFFKKKIDKDALRVGADIQEIAADLLDVYWSTIHIKLNPVVAAALLIGATNIYNFSQAIQNEFEEPATKKKKKKKKKNKPSSENLSDEDVTDVEYTEEEADEELQKQINALIETHNKNKK